MASGDVVIGGGDMARHWISLDALAATDNGVWVDVGPFRKNMELEITGITTATVQIRGDSGTTIPANSSHGDQLGLDITADGRREIDNPPRWIKTRISSWSSGTISTFLVGSI